MNYALDAIILIILIFFIYGGIRRGGVRSLIGLVCAVVAVWGASSLSSVVSQGFYSTFLEGSLTQQVGAVLQGAAGEDLTVAAEKVLDALPGPISSILTKGGFDAASFQQGTQWAAAQATEAIMSGVSKIMVDFLAVIFFLILLILFFIVLILIYRLVIRPVLRLPILRQIDSFIGFFIGILQCVLFLMVAVTVLHWMVSAMDPTPAIFSRETIDQTFLFRWVYDWNPFFLFFTV